MSRFPFNFSNHCQITINKINTQKEYAANKIDGASKRLSKIIAFISSGIV